MKSRLIQLSKGNIEYRVPEISCGAERLGGTVAPGRKVSMEVNLVSLNNVPMHLYFYSNDARIRVSQPLSIGRTGKMTVEINTVGLRPGRVLEGSIGIVYNGGEMRLPYSFTVAVTKNGRVVSAFETLDDFVAYAAENFEEAASLFGWKEFTDLPFMQDMKLMALYQTYVPNIRSEEGLREFLRAAGYEFSDEKRTAEAEAENPEEKEIAEGNGEKCGEKRKNLEVLRLFTAYECVNRFGKDVSGIDFGAEMAAAAEKWPADPMVHLLYAWYLIEEGSIGAAKSELIDFQDRIQKERLEHKDVYCLFLYLASLAQSDTERIEMSKKLTHRYYTDGSRTALMQYLEYRMNPEYEKDHTRAFSFLFQYHNMFPGLPVVYLEAASLFLQTTSDINALTAFELNTLLFMLRRGILTEEKLFEILAHELKNPRLLSPYMMVLKLGYRAFGNLELLQAVCNVFLQQKRLDSEGYVWYDEAVRRNLVMSGLNEYYLASLPKNAEIEIPRNVVLYFGLGHDIGRLSPDDLYRSVVTDYAEDEEISALYKARIDEYALKKLRTEEYSVRLIPVLNTVLDESYVDEKTAPGILEALYLQRIRSSVKDAGRVIVHYPQLKQEAVYALHDSEALLPVFSDEAVFAFETKTGRRIFDPEMTKEKVFENAALKKQCEGFVTDALLVQLNDMDRIIRQGALTDRDLFIVTELIRNRKIDGFYRKRLYETLIDLACDPSMAETDCCEFLLEADFSTLSPDYRARFLEVLIGRGYCRDAYRKILDFGFEGVRQEYLLALSERMVREPVAQDEPVLISICRDLFADGKATPPVFAYLAEYYEGLMPELMSLLKTMRKKKQPTGKLVERTLVQCFYVADDKDLDVLFDWYMNENRRDPAIRTAYLIKRSHDSFMRKRKLTENGAEELKKEVMHLPRIGMLALLQYMAETEEPFTQDDCQLAEALLRRAVDENIMLGCYKQLEKKVQMPSELEGRAYVEYRGENVQDVAVFGRNLPGGKYFHRLLNRVYPGVFTRSFILYSGEWINYYYSVRHTDGTVEEIDGDVVSRDSGVVSRGSRYDDIGHLELRVEKNDTRGAAELMRSLVLKDAMLEEIFR